MPEDKIEKGLKTLGEVVKEYIHPPIRMIL